MGSISVEAREDVAIVVLSTPDKLNAWDRNMRRALLAELRRLAGDDDCRAIVVTGEGDEAFCAGQDLDEARGWDADFSDTWVREIQELYDAARLGRKPIIAAINGVAAGSGLQFALCCDLRVAHEGARLGQPEVRSGLASVTGSWLIQRAVGGSRMRDLVLTARMLSGAEAHEWGLVNRLVARTELLGLACQLALELADLPPESFSLTKHAIAELEQDGYESAFDLAVRYQALVYETRAPQRVMGAFRSRRGRALRAQG